MPFSEEKKIGAIENVHASEQIYIAEILNFFV
jgi:hypothetical protein